MLNTIVVGIVIVNHLLKSIMIVLTSVFQHVLVNTYMIKQKFIHNIIQCSKKMIAEVLTMNV